MLIVPTSTWVSVSPQNKYGRDPPSASVSLQNKYGQDPPNSWMSGTLASQVHTHEPLHLQHKNAKMIAELISKRSLSPFYQRTPVCEHGYN